MRRRKFIRIISFLSAGIIVISGIAIKERRDLNKYKLQVQNSYSRSLLSLTESVNNISVILEKVQFLNSAKQQSMMAAELLMEAENAKNSLSQLPLSGGLDTINRFLSQIGNYAMSVSKNLILGKEAEENYSDNITVLLKTAQTISEKVGNSNIVYNNPENWSAEMEKELEASVNIDSLGGSMGELEDTLGDYPTLIYDGPYSDHILEKEPLMIKEAETVAKEQALKVATKTAETDELKFNGESKGKIEGYSFNNKNTEVLVSVKGGYPVFMRKTRKIGDYVLEYKQALEKAKRYLEKMNMNSFKETYYFTDEGVCVINFAFLDGKTLCYTDLVKVGVAMDTGEIVLYEASGYLTNHTDRAFESITATPETAAQKISQNLEIKAVELALIPTNSGGEVRCFEFTCLSGDDREILVYINALTLEEENILILLKNDGGTLTK